MSYILPEWLWVVIVSGVLMGLVKLVWSLRSKYTDSRFKSLEDWRNDLIKSGGALSRDLHNIFCKEVTDQMKVDMSDLGRDLKENLKQSFEIHKAWVETKFEGMDDKIENKILKELRKLNGNKE